MSQTYPLEGLRILLLDDDITYLGLIADIVEALGGAVSPAFSVAEAMRLLAKHDTDASVVDLLLFDSHGLRFIDDVRAVFPRMPVVLHTSMDLPPGYEDATVVYLPKPCTPETLAAAILDAIGRVDTTPSPPANEP